MSEVKKQVAKTFFWGILNEVLSKISPLILTILAARNLQLSVYSTNQALLWNLDLFYFLISAGFYDFFSTKIASSKLEGRPNLIPKMVAHCLVVRSLIATFGVFVFWDFISNNFLLDERSRILDPVKTSIFAIGVAASILDVSFVYVAQNKLNLIFKNITMIRLIALLFAVLWIRGPEDGDVFLGISLSLNFLIAMNSFVLSFKDYGLNFRLSRQEIIEFLGQWVYFPKIWLVVFLERIEFYLAHFFLDKTFASILVPPIRFSQMLSPFLLLGISVLYSDLISRNLFTSVPKKNAVKQSVFYSNLWILLLSVPWFLVLLVLGDKPLGWLFGISNSVFFEDFGTRYVLALIFLGIVFLHLANNLSQQVLVSMDRRREVLIWILGCISIAALISICFVNFVGELGVLHLVWMGIMVKFAIFLWSFLYTKKFLAL